jgi:hypothetical protein
MSKYHTEGLTSAELRRIADVVDFFDGFGDNGVHIDHIQIRTVDDEDDRGQIIGKVAFAEPGEPVFLTIKDGHRGKS